MDGLPATLAGCAATQGGLFTRAQALDAGLDDKEINRRVARGVWARVRRGAYAERAVWEAMDDRARHVLTVRAVLTRLDPPSFASHVSAAAAQDLRMLSPDLSRVHATRPDANSARRESGVEHHTCDLPEAQRGFAGDIQVTSLARTAMDVARCSSWRAGVVTADAALAAGASQEQIAEVLDGCRDWPGSRNASRVASFADGRSESVGESLARCLFHEIGLPRPELQQVIPLPWGDARVDFLWRKAGVVGEFDGKVKYQRALSADPSETAWNERRREVALIELGYVVVRLVWADLFAHEAVRARLMSAFRRAA